MDCLWSAFIKNGREDDYRWTDAYLQSDLRAIVDVKSPDQDLNELNAGPGMAGPGRFQDRRAAAQPRRQPPHPAYLRLRDV